MSLKEELGEVFEELLITYEKIGGCTFQIQCSESMQETISKKPRKAIELIKGEVDSIDKYMTTFGELIDKLEIIYEKL